MVTNIKIRNISIGDNSPTCIMGIINFSPESFYKPSIVKTLSDIQKTVLAMIDQGADIIDVGGASTAPISYYPDSKYISESDEKNRIIRAIKIIRDVTDLPISIDTMRASVAEEALKLGADIVNDVSGLKNDKNMKKVLSDYSPYMVLMASKKKPGDIKTLEELVSALQSSIDLAHDAGLKSNKIIIDPGFGFGKSVRFNMEILNYIPLLKKFGNPLLVGVSRKGFIKEIIGSENERNLLLGSLTASVISIIKGANIIRTHDVKEISTALKIINFI